MGSAFDNKVGEAANSGNTGEQEDDQKEKDQEEETSSTTTTVEHSNGVCIKENCRDDGSEDDATMTSLGCDDTSNRKEDKIPHDGDSEDDALMTDLTCNANGNRKRYCFNRADKHGHRLSRG